MSKYQFTERSPIEKSIEKLLVSELERKDLPDNFYRPIVDVYNTHYGVKCHVTFLFKNSFTQNESDLLFENFKNWKNKLNRVFGKDTFPGLITSSTSTIEVYKKSSTFYDENK